MESLELRNGHKDDDGLLAALDIDLPCGGNLENAKLGLEFGDIVLEINQSLSNGTLSLVGRVGWGIGAADDFGGDAGHLEGFNVLVESVSTSNPQTRHPPQNVRSFPQKPLQSNIQSTSNVSGRPEVGIILTGALEDDDYDEGECYG